jgi:hypothetical protein
MWNTNRDDNGSLVAWGTDNHPLDYWWGIPDRSLGSWGTALEDDGVTLGSNGSTWLL